MRNESTGTSHPGTRFDMFKKNPIINFPKSQTYGINLRCSGLYLYLYLAAKVVQFNSLRPSDACIYVRVN